MIRPERGQGDDRRNQPATAIIGNESRRAPTEPIR
jgi:hypothetical protein